MSEHTPGPWSYVDTGDGAHEIFLAAEPHQARYESQRVIEYAHSIDPEEEPEQFAEAEANARLITAAPDLLAACEAARGWWTLDNHALASTMLDQLDAAIAKARGEVPPC
jgi:hypothetical protein